MLGGGDDTFEHSVESGVLSTGEGLERRYWVLPASLNNHVDEGAHCFGKQNVSVVIARQLPALDLHHFEFDGFRGIKAVALVVIDQRFEPFSCGSVHLVFELAAFYEAVDLAMVHFDSILLHGLFKNNLRQLEVCNQQVRW